MEEINKLTQKEIGAATEVRKALGPGLLESAYEQCLFTELSLRKISFVRQEELPLEYKGVKLDCGYRIDLIIKNVLVLELKSCDTIEAPCSPFHIICRECSA
jgi:GxxExxY protein